MAEVLVSPERLERWVRNFEGRHGPAVLRVAHGGLAGVGEDGSTFTARLPFERDYAGPADPVAFADAGSPPADWAILLVRKHGFAVARLRGEEVTASKVGRRHVQGRTKAGGQSQQRFARRRENQAQQAYDAAADHAARLIADAPLVVLGGDREATRAVLRDPRLRALAAVVSGPLIDVPDPRRREVDSARAAACSVRMSVVNA